MAPLSGGVPTGEGVPRSMRSALCIGPPDRFRHIPARVVQTAEMIAPELAKEGKEIEEVVQQTPSRDTHHVVSATSPAVGRSWTQLRSKLVRAECCGTQRDGD